MSPRFEPSARRLLRARDAMDRRYAERLDITALAAIAHSSPAHFIRSFKETFGETPHRYLQRRRLERAMHLLRESERSVTAICFEVGFSSLGTFSRTFKSIIGSTPSAYREASRDRSPAARVPTCYVMAWTRPADSSFGEDEPGPNP